MAWLRYFAFAWLAYFCVDCRPVEDRKDVNYQELKAATQASTRYFDPVFLDTTHFTLTFVIQNYKVSLASDSVRIVPGPGLASSPGGSMLITFLDANRDTVKLPTGKGELLSLYRMASPLHHRMERGNRRGLYKVKSGSFAVPIPRNRVLTPRIARIVIEDTGLKKTEFDVAKLLQTQ